MQGQIVLGSDDEFVDDYQDKLKRSIDRLKTFEPEEGYYLAFSGGKDSVACYFLAKMASVKFDSHYAITSLDPPELTKFIKKNFPDVEMMKPSINMWDLVVKKRMPPTRRVRYCCETLKEEGGAGRIVITGVRWAESSSRKNTRSGVELHSFCYESKKVKVEKEKFNLMNDNADKRRMVETCATKGKHIVNPIIDWSDADVWRFIKENNLPYCHLYDEGFSRLGCIACPLAGTQNMQKEFIKWSYAFEKYISAFDKMIEKRNKDGFETKWDNGHDVMRWWLELSVEEYKVFLKEVRS